MLERGWLARQLREEVEERQDWPEWLKRAEAQSDNATPIEICAVTTDAEARREPGAREAIVGKEPKAVE